MRAVFLAEPGRYREAEAAFKDATSRDPDTQSASAVLSLTLEKVGTSEESLEMLRSGIRMQPDDGVAQFHFAQALVKQGA